MTTPTVPETTVVDPNKPAPAEHMIPKARLDEEIQKRKDLEARLSAIEQSSKDAEQKRLAETNDFKTLAEKLGAELEGLRPRAAVAEESEKVLSEVLTAQIAELPEQWRGVVPAGLTTAQKLTWLAQNKALFLKAKAVDIGAGHRGGDAPAGADLTQEERDIAIQNGMTPEEYAGYKNGKPPRK